MAAASSSSRANDKQQLLARMKNEFFLPPLRRNNYTIQQIIGEGAYGVVCSAVNNFTGEMVAVKRIMRVFEHVPEATRILRELKFLRLLGDHENVITIHDVLLPDDRDKFNDVFVVFELMPADLNRILRSSIELDREHVRWIMYQLIRGVNYLHDAGVFHRDLKPSNLLVNAECDLRICDFGLARASSAAGAVDTVFWTDYVATRWYRAPELIMSYLSHYSTAIDMWSVGCIFAELLSGGKPLFPGVNGYHQLELIQELVGTPEAEALAKIPNTKTKRDFMSLPPREPRQLQELFPSADPEALLLLRELIQLDPDRRPTAATALQHPYFRELHEADTIVRSQPVPEGEFAFDRQAISEEELRGQFLQEILLYHPDERSNYIGAQRMDAAQLRFALPSQASDFREQFKQVREDGSAREQDFFSMPNQRLGNMWERDDPGMQRMLAQADEAMQMETPSGLETNGLGYGLMHDRRVSPDFRHRGAERRET